MRIVCKVTAPVNYGGNLGELFKGSIERGDSLITQATFPVLRPNRVTRDVEVVFVGLDENLSPEGVREALVKEGWRAAELREMMGALLCEPTILDQYDTFALGQEFDDGEGSHFVVQCGTCRTGHPHRKAILAYTKKDEKTELYDERGRGFALFAAVRNLEAEAKAAIARGNAAFHEAERQTRPAQLRGDIRYRD